MSRDSPTAYTRLGCTTRMFCGAGEVSGGARGGVGSTAGRVWGRGRPAASAAAGCGCAAGPPRSWHAATAAAQLTPAAWVRPRPQPPSSVHSRPRPPPHVQVGAVDTGAAGMAGSATARLVQPVLALELALLLLQPAGVRGGRDWCGEQATGAAWARRRQYPPRRTTASQPASRAGSPQHLPRHSLLRIDVLRLDLFLIILGAAVWAARRQAGLGRLLADGVVAEQAHLVCTQGSQQRGGGAAERGGCGRAAPAPSTRKKVSRPRRLPAAAAAAAAAARGGPGGSQPHSQYWMALSVTSSSAQHSGQSSGSSMAASDLHMQAGRAYNGQCATLRQLAAPCTRSGRPTGAHSRPKQRCAPPHLSAPAPRPPPTDGTTVDNSGAVARAREALGLGRAGRGFTPSQNCLRPNRPRTGGPRHCQDPFSHHLPSAVTMATALACSAVAAPCARLSTSARSCIRCAVLQHGWMAHCRREEPGRSQPLRPPHSLPPMPRHPLHPLRRHPTIRRSQCPPLPACLPLQQARGARRLPARAPRSRGPPRRRRAAQGPGWRAGGCPACGA